MITRLLLPKLKTAPYSVLLLGPRQTGKTTLTKTVGPDLVINLAHQATYLAFSRNPDELIQRLKPLRPSSTVLLDEVQRIPSLLNTLQTIIDEGGKKGHRFLITGSSARKLKRGEANLLPGRIYSFELGPLVASEIGHDAFDVRKALSWGTLPGIWTEESEDARTELLRAYASTYLREEVQAEALTKNIEGFSRFLAVAAACNGQFLDISKLASTAEVPRQTAVRFFEILEDTLIVRRCSAFAHSERQKLTKHPRFFFFDTGVLNGLLDNFRVSDDRKGGLFETLVFNQILVSASALRKSIKISSYRTENDAEVDFIVELDGDTWAIEVKASRNVGRSDLTGFTSFDASYKKKKRKIVVIPEGVDRGIGDVEVRSLVSLLRAMKLA